MDPLWLTAIVTGVLALVNIGLVGVTVYYARETHRIRVNALRPVFSLTTDLHTMGNHINGLILVNSGPVARNVHIDVEPSIQDDYPKLYLPALYTGEHVRLTSQLQEKRQGGAGIRVKLSYSDAVANHYSEELSVDFRKLAEEHRELCIPESREVA